MFLYWGNFPGFSQTCSSPVVSSSDYGFTMNIIWQTPNLGVISDLSISIPSHIQIIIMVDWLFFQNISWRWPLFPISTTTALVQARILFGLYDLSSLFSCLLASILLTVSFYLSLQNYNIKTKIHVSFLLIIGPWVPQHIQDLKFCSRCPSFSFVLQIKVWHLHLDVSLINQRQLKQNFCFLLPQTLFLLHNLPYQRKMTSLYIQVASQKPKSCLCLLIIIP